MTITHDGDGIAVACTLRDWLARGHELPELGQVRQLTILGLERDSTFPVESPPPVTRALVVYGLTGDPTGLSEACLGWARRVAGAMAR